MGKIEYRRLHRANKEEERMDGDEKRGKRCSPRVSLAVCVVVLLVAVVLVVISRSSRPSFHYRAPIGGSLARCARDTLARSSAPPTNAHRVRPADIDLVTAMGDSISVGAKSENEGDHMDVGRLDRPGNSFVMGGDGELETQITLPNILRSLNPRLDGFSTGRDLLRANTKLNVAIPGMLADDMIRQAGELITRLRAYPDYKKRWKLVHIFIGTNDIRLPCKLISNSTSPELYKQFLLEAIQMLKTSLPRTIVSIIQLWNVNFSNGANDIITDQHFCGDIEKSGQEATEGYRKAVDELEQLKEFDSDDDFTVVAQHIFDDLLEPLREESGAYIVDFYARDIFHLSKFGNSLVARQLWKSLLAPIGSQDKRATPAEMASLSRDLTCPDPACPFIRTVRNSRNCGE